MTTRIENLNRTMLCLEANGDITEEDYRTYKMLLTLFALLEAKEKADDALYELHQLMQ